MLQATDVNNFHKTTQLSELYVDDKSVDLVEGIILVSHSH